MTLLCSEKFFISKIAAVIGAKAPGNEEKTEVDFENLANLEKYQ